MIEPGNSPAKMLLAAWMEKQRREIIIAHLPASVAGHEQQPR